MPQLNKIIAKCAPSAYIVGGALRDSLLKRPSGDIDLALPRADVRPAAMALARALKASAFEMDPDFCVWRITAKNGLQIDLSALIGKDIKEDLQRRDFTINALAYPLSAPYKIALLAKGVRISGLQKKYLIDGASGAADIKAKTVRATNSKVFTDDPLRLLRAYRTAAELGFKIAPSTMRLIKKHAALIARPAGERIQEELKRILRCLQTRKWLECMDKTGLLSALFPVLEQQKTCAKCYYGKGGVFTHTLRVVERMDYLLTHLKNAFPKFHKKLAPHTEDAALYQMAALLHDIAKPATAKHVGDRLRFFYHEEQGAKMAEEILKKLKYSSAEIKIICKMIEFHLRPSNLASNEIITDKAVYKFFKELGPAAVPMLLLCWADYTSYVQPAQIPRLLKRAGQPVITIEEGKKNGPLGKTLRHLQMLNFLFNKYFNETKKIITPQRLLDGKEVMDILHLPPGPRVGEILEKLTEAQVEGIVKNKEQAKKYLRGLNGI